MTIWDLPARVICDHSKLSSFIDGDGNLIRHCPLCGFTSEPEPTPGQRMLAWDEYLDALEAHEEATCRL